MDTQCVCTPIVIAMIEHRQAVEHVEEILTVRGLDAIMIGPYDLSASLGMPGHFETTQFMATLGRIAAVADRHHVPCGIHVVMPDPEVLHQRMAEGYRFLAYGMDAVLLHTMRLARHAEQP